MKFNVVYFFIKKFLPSKRHRKLREKQEWGVCSVDIREVSDNEFPVAFIVHDYVTVYEDAEKYSDFENKEGDYRSFAEEIRTFGGKLYKLVRVTHGAAISLIPSPKEEIQRELERDVREQFMLHKEQFPIGSIVVSDNSYEQEDKIRTKADQYLYFNGAFWEECSEPRYMICTFGLGHNHGGTGFFVEDFYNENIPKDNYFNALQRNEAIAYGKAVAEARGDTESIASMGEYCNIEVLMPELVKVDPNKQHGEGCEYLNECEELIRASGSIGEAGILCLIKAFK